MSVYHRPETLDEALSLLRQSAAITVMAGATDIYPAQTTRAAWGHREAPEILDVSGIAKLRGIEDRGDYWWIGATTTWSDILRAHLPPLFDGLKAAAREIGGVQIQNRGTIGGNLCTASPAGDSIPCLLSLDAEIEYTHSQARLVPLSEFHVGYRKTVLGAQSLMTGIRVPKQAGRAIFRKLGARRYLVISIAMASLVFETNADGKVTVAKVAVGACSAVAQRLPHLEGAMRGRSLSADVVTPQHLAHLTPIDDIRASASYRRAAALQLVRDIIAEAAEDQGGGRA